MAREELINREPTAASFCLMDYNELTSAPGGAVKGENCRTPRRGVKGVRRSDDLRPQ